MEDRGALPRIADVNSFEDLAQRIPEFRKDYWIFRGVTNHTYDLKPKIGRPESAKLLDLGDQDPAQYRREQEELLTNLFKRTAAPYVMHEPKTTLEWLALAQHHGMHTRLLDWTESLLIAAYFAVEKGKKYVTGDDGKPDRRFPMIFCARSIPVADKDKQNNLDELQDVALYHPPHISPRIPAQRSVFTVHKNPTQPYDSPHMVRLTIKGSPMKLKFDLNACGINRASLFPDIDGLAQHNSWLFKWGKLPPG